MAEKINYFGDGPFSGEYSDLAQSVKRIADKKAQGFLAGWDQKQVTDMKEQSANKSVADAYITKVVNPEQELKKEIEEKE